MNHTIEGNRLFPYIAWATIILFAIFTCYLALELQESAAYLDDQMDVRVQALDSV